MIVYQITIDVVRGGGTEGTTAPPALARGAMAFCVPGVTFCGLRGIIRVVNNF